MLLLIFLHEREGWAVYDDLPPERSRPGSLGRSPPGKQCSAGFVKSRGVGLFRQNKIRIAHEKVPYVEGKTEEDNFQVVLTASTEDLQKFMLKYMDDPNAFKNDYSIRLKKKS